MKSEVKRVPTCFSIGYQGRPIYDFCALLIENRVEVLVDVRERAWSMRPPYRKTALRESLAAAGIEYIHLREAGNPFRPRKGEPKDFEDCARRYREHLRRNPDVLGRARELARSARVAFFCYEEEAAECHRGVLIQAMAKGWPSLEVCHI